MEHRPKGKTLWSYLSRCGNYEKLVFIKIQPIALVGIIN